MKPTTILSALIMAASLSGLQAQNPATPPPTTAPQPSPPSPSPEPPQIPPSGAGHDIPPPPAPPIPHTPQRQLPPPLAGQPLHPDSREAHQDQPRDDHRGQRLPRNEEHRDVQSEDHREAQPRGERRDEHEAPRDFRRGNDRDTQPQAGPRDDRRPELRQDENRRFQDQPRFDRPLRGPRSGRFRGFERGGYGRTQPPMNRQNFRGFQGPQDGGEQHRPAGNPQPPEGRFGPHPVPPLFAALDSDHNGILSAKEIASAGATLFALDKNGDGQLTPDELRPSPLHERSAR